MGDDAVQRRAGRSRWWRVMGLFAEPVLELAFLVMTTVCALLFLLDEGSFISLTPLTGTILMLAWCPLWWWKFRRARVGRSPTAWFFLAVAVVLTGIMVVAVSNLLTA